MSRVLTSAILCGRPIRSRDRSKTNSIGHGAQRGLMIGHYCDLIGVIVIIMFNDSRSPRTSIRAYTRGRTWSMRVVHRNRYKLMIPSTTHSGHQRQVNVYITSQSLSTSLVYGFVESLLLIRRHKQPHLLAIKLLRERLLILLLWDWLGQIFTQPLANWKATLHHVLILRFPVRNDVQYKWGLI